MALLQNWDTPVNCNPCPDWSLLRQWAITKRCALGGQACSNHCLFPYISVSPLFDSFQAPSCEPYYALIGCLTSALRPPLPPPPPFILSNTHTKRKQASRLQTAGGCPLLIWQPLTDFLVLCLVLLQNWDTPMSLYNVAPASFRHGMCVHECYVAVYVQFSSCRLSTLLSRHVWYSYNVAALTPKSKKNANEL